MLSPEIQSLLSEPLGPCTVWTKALSAAGYGQKWAGEKVVYVHRLAFEAAYGPIPEGTEIDHLCRNRACYNVAHLEAVTHAENMRRSGPFRRSAVCPRGHVRSKKGKCITCRRERDGYLGPGNDAYSKRTHCPKGHPYSSENTYVNPRGSRECRMCRAAGRTRAGRA